MGYSKILLNGVTDPLIDLTEDTVEAGYLIEGKTAHDAAGDLIVGNLTMSALTANAESILDGQTARIANGVDPLGQEVTGTMTNNGNVTLTLSDVNGANQIPRGFHNGSGTFGISDADIETIRLYLANGISVLGITGTNTSTGTGDAGTPETKTVTPVFGQAVTVQASDSDHYLYKVVVNPITRNYEDHESEGKGTWVTIGGSTEA